MANYVGGCQCGAIRYELSERPIRSFQCQCRDCQKDSGGGHSSVMVFNSRTFVLKGEARETLRTADSGARKRKGFCPACGSPLYNKPESQPQYIGIYVGSLDDASSFKPDVVLFTSRGHAWDHLDATVTKRPEWHGSS
jgi:hypothetical protein